MMFPKPHTPRDPKYLAWIRTLPCIQCGATHYVQAHHAESGGMGIKASDHTALPLCYLHHKEWHDHKGKCGGWDRERVRAVCDKLREIYLRGK